MDNKIIYDSFYMLTNQLLENIEKNKNIATVLQSFFSGCKNSEENTIKMPLISNQGEDKMKFKGKTIFKNKKCNTWYTRYRIDGKQYYISGRSQSEVLKELKNKLNYIPKEKKKYTSFQDWYNEWFELFKKNKVKQSTIDVYNSLLKHIDKKLFEKNIKEITKKELTQIINNVPGERTKQKLYELLNDIFTKAENYDVCKNYMKNIEKPKHIRENGIALTNEDEEKFINYCLKNKKYIFLVTLYQGLRKSETLGLTKEDIDYINNEININKTYNDRGQFDTTKNKTSNRIMPLFNKTKEILNRTNLDNKRIFNISNAKMQSEFRKIIQELNLNSKYTIHSLRHTFITHCQDNNIPEHIIQNWVGHEIGSQVTKSVYTHINKETNILNIERLNNSKFYSNSTH